MPPVQKVVRGKFLKRTIASTNLSKRISRLNEVLVSDIRYEEVRELLAGISTADATRVLTTMESKAADIKDPTAYLVKAARRMLAKSGQLGEEDLLKLERRVEWLNINAPLNQELSFERIGEELAGIRIQESMEILRRLEESAGEVRDPTAYVISAVMKKERWNSDRKGKTRKKSSSGPVKPVIKSHLKTKVNAKKFETRVAWLNQNAGLAAQLDPRIVDLLNKLGKQSFALLKNLEENAEEVRDPTAYVTRAAKRLLKESREDGGDVGALEKRVSWLNRSGFQLDFDRVLPFLLNLPLSQAMEVLKRLENTPSVRDANAYVIAGARRQCESGEPENIEKRISWLNKNAGLTDALDSDRVMPFLTNVSRSQAMDVLKRLEENAATVRDPNAYVVASARRAEGGAVVQEADGGEAWAKLDKRIVWINRNVGLPEALDSECVIPSLLNLPQHSAMEVLKRLEENAATVRDPNAYVVAGARKVEKELSDHREPEATVEDDLPPEDPTLQKLEKRVRFLNKNSGLSSELVFDRVAPELMKLSYADALDLLNNLEEHCDNVRDPTAYICAAVRKNLGGGRGETRRDSGGKGGGKIQPWQGSPPGLPALPASAASERSYERSYERSHDSYTPRSATPRDVVSSDETKLKQRVRWLNNNVCGQAKLSYESLGSSLNVLPVRQTMEILRHFEEKAAEIRDPEGWVKAAVRRESKSKSVGAPAFGERPVSERPVSERPVSERPVIGALMVKPEPIGVMMDHKRRRPSFPEVNAPAKRRGMSASRAVDDKLTYYDDRRQGRSSRGSEQEMKLSKRIEWLNNNVQLTKFLDFSRVSGELLRIGTRQAMDLLKQLEENAPEVRDPNGYVLSASKRFSAG
eukprot:CAMPEP_0194486034 /NCGR_PEP_ID=MMETSP0253-20130528/6833_1 /TAXON_ID=2966 /ORGANISM="Noctiluca scintillans" /LENGTH=866 /DNA_ID=CAMNT_0039326077 /DNA_START=58 /DNA_END=2658 /DNA_ORIENTATION=+